MVVPLAVVKSNPSGTTYELKFIAFSDFTFVIILKQIRTFPFETKSVPPLSAKFKKNSYRRASLCLIGVHLPA